MLTVPFVLAIRQKAVSSLRLFPVQFLQTRLLCAHARLKTTCAVKLNFKLRVYFSQLTAPLWLRLRRGFLLNKKFFATEEFLLINFCFYMCDNYMFDNIKLY